MEILNNEKVSYSINNNYINYNNVKFLITTNTASYQLGGNAFMN